MKGFQRELLNGLFVLVVGSLISTAFEAFHVEFDSHLWALIVLALAVAVGGYTMFSIGLGFMTATEARERAVAESTSQREEEWLKRVGTPARLEPNLLASIVEALGSLAPGSDYTVLFYVGAEGGLGYLTSASDLGRQQFYDNTIELVKSGTIREYKRIISFDSDVLAKDHALAGGTLSVGQGPGTIDPVMAEHCRVMMQTKNCVLYVAPAVFRGFVMIYGANKVSIGIEATHQESGGRMVLGGLFFTDPPNGEIVEHFRQMERATERFMVAVRQIRFPEQEAATGAR